MKHLYLIPITTGFLLFQLSTSAQTDFALIDAAPLEYQVTGTHGFSVAIKKVGATGFGNGQIYWQQDNGPVNNVSKAAIDVQWDAPYGQITDPAFKMTYATAGTYMLKTWIKVAGDINPANDTVTKTVRVFSNLPKKNVVLEVFKHQGCGPCYPAAKYLDTFVSKNNDYAIANIYTVTTDVIYNADGAAVDNVYKYAHPMPLFDRFKFPFRKNIQGSFYGNGTSYGLNGYGDREQYYEPVQVSFKTASFNTATRELKVTLNAKFFDNLNGDYRFNLLVTEDSVKAYQAAAPNPNDYYHMKVLREMMGGSWGEQGSLPTTISNNYEKDHQFTYTVPNNYDINKITLIGMVQKFNSTDIFDRKILNSAKLSFHQAIALNTQSISKLQETVSIYPNPAKDKIYLSFSERGSYTITLFDISGKLLTTTQTSASTAGINIEPYTSGTYYLKIDNGEQVYSKKIIKQ